MTIEFDPPIHPGEVLREEYLVPMNLSAGALAKRIGVPRTRVERLAKERTAVTPDTALRLGRALGTTAQFWITMQARYDLALAERESAADLAAIRPLPAL